MTRQVGLMLLIAAVSCSLGLPAERTVRDVFLQRVYGIDQEATSIASGDFNGDGRRDLVTSSYSGADLSILLGNDLGTFDPQIRVSGQAGNTVHVDVVVADFDGDGADDIAARSLQGVDVWRGNGDATFAAEVSYSTSDQPPFADALAVADLNSDGKPDIVAAGRHHAVLLSNGDGTFQVTLLSDGAASYILTGDFTGDGLADIADGDRVWVRSGEASSPTFAPVAGLAPGFHGVAFDFDGDGQLDIAACRNFEVGVYLGRGNGLLDPAVSYSVPFRAREMVLADLNRDGAPDLVVSVSAAQSLAPLDPPAVLLSNGDGTFGEAVSYAAPLYGGPMVAGDFSGDGKVDVAFAPLYGQTIIPPDKAVSSRNLSLAYVMRGDGQGALVSERVERYPVGESVFSGRAQDSIVTADLNGDGRLDLATANSASNDVSVLVGNADGTFTVVAGAVAGIAPVALAAGFFDPGATLDLAVANAGSQDISILLGNGDATFVPASAFPVGSAPSGLVQADFNGDGVQDLATANAASDDVSVLLGLGDGTFSAPAFIDVGAEPVALAVVHLDGVGGPDLAVANQGSNDISILLGYGDGTFGPETRYASASALLRTLRAADLNGDSLQDVAVVSHAEPHVQIFLGDGAGALSSPVGVTLGTGAVDLAILDLDGDGRPDLATTHSAVSLMGVIFGADGGFGTRDEFATEAEGRLAAGDFDGDGLPDLAVLGKDAPVVAVHINQLPILLEFTTSSSTLVWPRLVGTDYFNVYRGSLSDLHDGDGDGLPDSGYGGCRTGLDPDPTDSVFVDNEVPPPGEGYLYLMARVGAQGEADLGSTSEGLARNPAVSCP